MARNTENNGVRTSYGRNTIAASNCNDCSSCSTNTTVLHGDDEAGILVVKGNGKINSTGVIPDGSISSLLNAQTEVEFTINIYRKCSTYQGNVFIVSYDTRKKINSNTLTFFKQIDNDEIICMFEVPFQKGCQTCVYDLIVSMSPTSCQSCNAGALFAYSAPIFNEGVNIGGVLQEGEIRFCEEVTRTDEDQSRCGCRCKC